MTKEARRRPPFLAEDGRTVIVALDHGLGMGHLPGLQRPGELLRALAGAGPDGFILPMGMGRIAAGLDDAPPWLLTADYFATSTLPATSGRSEIHGPVWTAEDARIVGASGLKILLVFGRNDPDAFLSEVQTAARLVSQAATAGLPVMIETVLWGRDVPPGREDDARWVVDAARTGFELGADLLKIAIPDDLGPLRELTSGLPIPIVLMGGPAGDPAETLRRIEAAMGAGASGVALGRNVWNRDRPERFVAALRDLVHGGVSSVEATHTLDR